MTASLSRTRQPFSNPPAFLKPFIDELAATFTVGDPAREAMSKLKPAPRKRAVEALQKSVRLEGALPMKPSMRSMAYYQVSRGTAVVS